MCSWLFPSSPVDQSVRKVGATRGKLSPGPTASGTYHPPANLRLVPGKLKNYATTSSPKNLRFCEAGAGPRVGKSFALHAWPRGQYSNFLVRRRVNRKLSGCSPRRVNELLCRFVGRVTTSSCPHVAHNLYCTEHGTTCHRSGSLPVIGAKRTRRAPRKLALFGGAKVTTPRHHRRPREGLLVD
jgi:hypothetical protein